MVFRGCHALGRLGIERGVSKFISRAFSRSVKFRNEAGARAGKKFWRCNPPNYAASLCMAIRLCSEAVRAPAKVTDRRQKAKRGCSKEQRKYSIFGFIATSRLLKGALSCSIERGKPQCRRSHLVFFGCMQHRAVYPRDLASRMEVIVQLPDPPGRTHTNRGAGRGHPAAWKFPAADLQ